MSRRFSPCLAVALVTIAVALAAGTAVASAQGAIAVPQGSNFTVENGTECAANADVIIFYASPARDAVRVETTISDDVGHFSTDVALPGNAALGAGTVSVDCGIADAVLLYDIEVVASIGGGLLSYVPYLLAAVAALAVIGVVAVRIDGAKERKAKAPAAPAEVLEPEPLTPVDVPQDGEDDPDYWFWDAKTERGLVKRLACLSEQTFFLHEIPASAFNALLENIALVGPEVALERAFFRVAVGDIDEIRHHGTEMRVTYRGGDGFVSKTIDLATAVEDVMGLLSRRVPVMADAPPVPAP